MALVLWHVLCLFGLPLQMSMESDKSSERQHLLERLLEAVKQVAEHYCRGKYRICAEGFIRWSGDGSPALPHYLGTKLLSRSLWDKCPEADDILQIILQWCNLEESKTAFVNLALSLAVLCSDGKHARAVHLNPIIHHCTAVCILDWLSFWLVKTFSTVQSSKKKRCLWDCWYCCHTHLEHLHTPVHWNWCSE